MFHAVSFALMDSINVLLIGVLFAVAVIHPNPRRYGKVASLLVVGDWFGVLLLSIPTLAVLHRFESGIRNALESAQFGWVLVIFGLISVVLTLRGGDPAPLIARLTRPLRVPSAATFLSGSALGIIQSITSVPFFIGIAYLTTTDLSTVARYLALVLYATLALSLPALSGLALGFVLRYPTSWLATFIANLRHREDALAKSAGYVVAAILILLGLPKIL